MTRVGEHSLQNDTLQQVMDRQPEDWIPAVMEGGTIPRAEGIVQPEERGRTAPIRNLSEFYELLQKTLLYARQNDNFEYELRYSKDFPPDAAKLPCFTSKLISRGPYLIKGVRELAPRHIEDFPDPENPGTEISLWIRRQTNVVQVTVWAKKRRVADQLADWVEDKFYEYLWALDWAGTGHPIIWLGQDEDVEKTIRNQTMHGSPIRFEVTTEKLAIKRVTNLRKLRLTLGLIPSDPEDEA